MIRRSLALITLVLFVTQANAGHIVFVFTQPFFDIEFDSTNGKVTASCPDFDSPNGGVKTIVKQGKLKKSDVVQVDSLGISAIPTKSSAKMTKSSLSLSSTAKAMMA